MCEVHTGAGADPDKLRGGCTKDAGIIVRGYTACVRKRVQNFCPTTHIYWPHPPNQSLIFTPYHYSLLHSVLPRFLSAWAEQMEYICTTKTPSG